MSDIQFRSDMTVDLVDHMSGDEIIVRAARVSTAGDLAQTSEIPDVGEYEGLINFLMKNRHGSPFEHCVMTFFVHAPIFTWREIMRHRIASYNEESGRYKQLEPTFYLPNDNRAMVQVGKAGAYDFVPGTAEQVDRVQSVHREVAKISYAAYEELLGLGVAKEVARMSLPLNIYSSAYITMNARGLMNFLSLRTKSEASTFPSFPQREIAMVAEQMEAWFTQTMPITAAAFQANGRVAP